MAYGREQLRKAGEALANLDRRYADAIMDRYADPNDPNPDLIKGLIGMYAGGMPISLGYTPSPGNAGPVRNAQISSAIARYAMPAAGVTLAGKGLYDIALALSQQTDGTVSP